MRARQWVSPFDQDIHIGYGYIDSYTPTVQYLASCQLVQIARVIVVYGAPWQRRAVLYLRVTVLARAGQSGELTHNFRWKVRFQPALAHGFTGNACQISSGHVGRGAHGFPFRRC